MKCAGKQDWQREHADKYSFQLQGALRFYLWLSSSMTKNSNSDLKCGGGSATLDGWVSSLHRGDPNNRSTIITSPQLPAGRWSQSPLRRPGLWFIKRLQMLCGLPLWDPEQVGHSALFNWSLSSSRGLEGNKSCIVFVAPIILWLSVRSLDVNIFGKRTKSRSSFSFR